MDYTINGFQVCNETSKLKYFNTTIHWFFSSCDRNFLTFESLTRKEKNRHTEEERERELMKATFQRNTRANIQNPQTVTSKTWSYSIAVKHWTQKYIKCKLRVKKVSINARKGEIKSRCVSVFGMSWVLCHRESYVYISTIFKLLSNTIY